MLKDGDQHSHFEDDFSFCLLVLQESIDNERFDDHFDLWLCLFHDFFNDFYNGTSMFAILMIVVHFVDDGFL